MKEVTECGLTRVNKRHKHLERERLVLFDGDPINTIVFIVVVSVSSVFVHVIRVFENLVFKLSKLVEVTVYDSVLEMFHFVLLKESWGRT